MDREMRELLERGIRAIESLSEEPEIKVQTFPAVCPHCEKVNPIVEVNDQRDSGKLGEIVIPCKCLECGNGFFAIPFQFQVARTVEDANNLMAERAEMTGYEH
jgi:hypothetical protein